MSAAVRRLVLAPTAPVVLAGIAFLVAGDPAGGFGAAGARTGVLIVLVAAYLGGTVGGSGRRDLLRDGLVLAAGAGAAALLASAGDVPTADVLPIASVAVVAWLLPWCLSLPLRSLGLVAAGRIVALGSSAALLGTPWLVPGHWSDLPSWVVAWNPLARLHGSILGEDWLHGPVLYRRVGELHYDYPAWDERLALVGAVVGGSLALAGVLHRVRRRYAVGDPAQA